MTNNNFISTPLNQILSIPYFKATIVYFSREEFLDGDLTPKLIQD